MIGQEKAPTGVRAKDIRRPNSNAKRRLPAYAAPLAEMRRQGLAPAQKTIIVRLDKWLPEDRPECVASPQCVIPPGSNPHDFGFGFAQGLDVLIAWWPSITDESRLRALGREVLQFNPRRLIALDIEAGEPWFIKSLSRGVEVAL